MDMIFRTYAAVTKGTGLGARQIRVVASDPTVDRVDDIMVPEGCDLSGYRNNPIVLAQHDPNHPIGNADVTIKNGRVEALITFSPEGISAKADEYCGLYKAGILRAVSVGFDPIESKPIAGAGTKYLRWSLLEISCVSVPANPAATTIERAAKLAALRKKVDGNPWMALAPRREASADWEAAFLKSEFPDLSEGDALAVRHDRLAKMSRVERRHWYQRERSFRETFKFFDRMSPAMKSVVDVLFDSLSVEQRATFRVAFPMFRGDERDVSREERLAAVATLEEANSAADHEDERGFRWDPNKSNAENAYLQRLYLTRLH